MEDLLRGSVEEGTAYVFWTVTISAEINMY